VRRGGAGRETMKRAAAAPVLVAEAVRSALGQQSGSRNPGPRFELSTARSVRKQEQRRAQILRILPLCTRSLSTAAPHFDWQGPDGSPPRGDRCQFITWPLSFSPLGGLIVNSGRSARGL